MLKFKNGDRIKIHSIRERKSSSGRVKYIGKMGIVIDNEGDSIENRWIVKFDNKELNDSSCGETSGWVFFDEETSRVVKNTALARKMYPKHIVEGEWLYV